MELNPDMYNADELVPPIWMDREFIETVMKEAKNGDFNAVIDFNIGPATVKGDHYASVMFRAVVRYMDRSNSKQEISLIIKTMPEVEGAKLELLNESPIFEVEIEMFRDIIPKFHELLRSIGDDTILGAKMLYYTLKPKKIIVLEDITKLNYATVGKQRMCKLPEVKMALSSLAKWHACSLVLNDMTNGRLQNFTNGVYNMPGTEKNTVFTKGTERVAQLAKDTPKLHKYADKLKKIENLVYEKCRNTYEICKKKGRINVLTHGDFHVKNLMFQFNAESNLAEKIIFVDFQMCVWGSMALDLLYCIYMMIDSETRDNLKDELIYNFFNEFIDYLKKLNYKGKIPKFIDLQIDMLRMSPVELFLATTFLPFMVSLEENPEMDPDTIMTDQDVQVSLYKSQNYIDQIEILLKRFLYNGYIDRIIEDDDDDDEDEE